MYEMAVIQSSSLYNVEKVSGIVNVRLGKKKHGHLYDGDVFRNAVWVVQLNISKSSIWVTVNTETLDAKWPMKEYPKCLFVGSKYITFMKPQIVYLGVFKKVEQL